MERAQLPYLEVMKYLYLVASNQNPSSYFLQNHKLQENPIATHRHLVHTLSQKCPHELDLEYSSLYQLYLLLRSVLA